MGGNLRVTAEGLRALASHCDTVAGELTSTTVPTTVTTSNQASASAIGTCDGRIAAAGAALAAWTSATAGTLTAAATAYTRQDDKSAGDLDTAVV